VEEQVLHTTLGVSPRGGGGTRRFARAAWARRIPLRGAKAQVRGLVGAPGGVASEPARPAVEASGDAEWRRVGMAVEGRAGRAARSPAGANSTGVGAAEWSRGGV